MSHPMKANFNKIRYSPGGPGEAYYYDILEKIQPLIRRGGHIRTADAWAIAEGTYSIVAAVFCNIMDKMVADGRAEKQAKGRYFVEPSEGFVPPVVEAPEVKVIRQLSRRVGPWYSKVYNCWMTPASNSQT